MELREMIEAAAKISGDQKKLAKEIGLSPNNITEAKAGRRGLPTSACYKLGAILDLDPAAVVAASELVTEKNPEKRAVFAPFVRELPRKAAAWAVAAIAATTASIAPTDAYANDTFKVSGMKKVANDSMSYGRVADKLPIMRI